MCTDKKPQRRVAGKAVSISLALVLAALLAALPSWALVIVRRVPLNVQPLSVHAHQGPLLESRRVTTLTSASDLQALAHTDRRAVLQQLVEPEPLSPGLAGFGSLLPPPTTYPLRPDHYP